MIVKKIQVGAWVDVLDFLTEVTHAQTWFMYVYKVEPRPLDNGSFANEDEILEVIKDKYDNNHAAVIANYYASQVPGNFLVEAYDTIYVYKIVRQGKFA